MDVEQRFQALEKKLSKTSLVAGMAFGLAIVLAVYVFVQLMSN